MFPDSIYLGTNFIGNIYLTKGSRKFQHVSDGFEITF